jgi:hypothetical protein
VDITWAPPAWSGYGPVTEYEIGYGTGRVTEWVRVPASARAHTLTLDANRNHVFLMRAISSDDRGNHTKVIKLLKHGAPGTPAVDPQVTVSEADGTITVDTVGPVGSSAAYPRMTVKVEPTLNKGTFRDEHVIANGASQTVFTQVPCGVYTDTVTGFGPGLAKEFGRKVVNRCDTGLVPADLWKVVYGQAKISGNTVDVTTTGERRIMSTTKRTSQDMVLTTTAALHTGLGYGVWARANLTNGSSVTGYSFQYDPGYATVSSFGKALLLRLWNNGRECGTPLAKVPFPAGVDVYSPHDIMVVVKGDTLYATIDGKVVFNVDSLKDAVAKNGCGMSAPTGSEIGFRTWSSSTATFTNTTLS